MCRRAQAGRLFPLSDLSGFSSFFSHVWMRVPLHVCLSEMPVGENCITWPRCFLRSLNTDTALLVLQKPARYSFPGHILDTSLHQWCQSFWSLVISNLDQCMGSYCQVLLVNAILHLKLKV